MGKMIRELLALAVVAVVVLLGSCTLEARATPAVPRPAPLTLPTPAHGVPPAPAADRRPVEQNPMCWITNPGWPRCFERTDTP